MKGGNRLAIARLCRDLADSTRCPDCGKLTIVLNAKAANGAAGHQAETVSPETHCACSGGPAAPVKGKTDADFLGYGVPDGTDLSASISQPAADDAYSFTFPRGKHAPPKVAS